MTANPAPVADWVTIPDLYRDPFPIYDRLRAEGGVHWVPQVGRYLITSYDAVHATEFDQETFSANEEGSLQIRAMGHSMLRRDDPEHYAERAAWQPVLRPGVVKRTWRAVFERNADRYIDELVERGPDADLIWDFAAPFAAENLREILGFHNVHQTDLQRWSQTLIDATGNYADDPAVWELGRRSFDEVDLALDEMLTWHVKHPDHSLISSLLAMPGDRMPIEKIRANIKMTIGGGLNEPRDALGVAAWALLSHPDQRRAVEEDPALWSAVFEESLRWIAPIGLYSRQTTRDVELSGVLLPAGAKLGICILSANRDESVWDDADRFDIRREVKPHLAFSKGVHVCLGAWVARSQVADIGLPRLFGRLRGLDLVADRPAQVGGWVFRGMLKLPVQWSSDSGAAGVGAAADGAAAPTAGSTETATPSTPARVAIVGAGPAGCFTAQALRRAAPDAQIDVFDALPVPYGLLRYGVASDHQGTKSVARQFDRLFDPEHTRFHGNVRLGADVTLERLRESFDAVVLATGLHSDVRLAVPGSELPGIVGAGALTRAANGHPDEAGTPHLGENVVVVGHGNVAMDVVRLLSRDPQDYDGSDIDDDVLREIAGDVRTVHVVGRSLPSAARFDPVMVRELAGLAGVRHVVHGADLDTVPAGKDARLDAVRELTSSGDGDGHRERVTVEWWFGLSPVRIEGDAAAEAVVFASPDGEVRLAADSVVTAVGFAADPESPLEPAAHASGRVEPGLYTAGWLRRGPRGTIPDQRADARGLAAMILEDLAAHTSAEDRPARREWERLAPAVDADGWRRVDLQERLAAVPGRERRKLRSREELLAAARDESIALPPRDDGPAAARGFGVPVTVAFASESGGAELVTDDLRRVLEPTTDVRVLDLGEARPDDLDPARLHLVVSSTYGDGEVPTAARPFHAALRSGAHRLDGLRYAVFGMGDRSYTKTYSRGSELLDEALAACGAERVGEYGRHDAGSGADPVEAAQEWLDGIGEVVGADVAVAAGADATRSV
ncbi:cytochrome P450 [Labedella phragmitis]|uniref:Cytochrome P450 n=1 Tax=Labedella phragmitis TaxID=2498849 RepID=A0A444PXS6_9MICO|nr:cytochrome P450 [Labedella phragmitis]RWZ52678.1 cytochrome P450 [Labedella phragmitis]